MRTFFVVCGLLLLVVGLGVLIGLTTMKPEPAKRSGSPVSSGEPQPVEETAIPAAEPKARLHLPRVAVVDLPRLVAAHPWTAAHQQMFADKLSDAQALSDPKAQAAAKRIAEVEHHEEDRLVVSDLQRIIAAPRP